MAVEYPEEYDPVVRGTVYEWWRDLPWTLQWRLQLDREDLIQECRIKLWQEAHRLDPNQNPKAYIRRMCRQHLNRLKERKFDRDLLFRCGALPEDKREDD